jgi:hypothetical protein
MVLNALVLSAVIVVVINKRVGICILLYLLRYPKLGPGETVEQLLNEVGGYMPELKGDVLCDCCDGVKEGIKVEMIKTIIRKEFL